jgi:hypothetical protein
MLKNMVEYYDSNLDDAGRGDLFGEAADDWNTYVNDISNNY